MKLSIIVPTLNEAKHIALTLNSVLENSGKRYLSEIILVDAGSEDDTVSVAKPLVDHTLINMEFQGKKFQSLNAGAKVASGDVFFFLDADCMVPAGYDDLIARYVKDGYSGGAFEYAANSKNWYFRLIEIVNRTRYRIDKLYFGDQGLFCTKEAFINTGGFPEEPIMEAAYFCKKLRKTGMLKLIREPIGSSVRRFEKGGVLKVLLIDFWIWLLFLLGIDISAYAGDYWADNKKRLID